MNTLYNVKFQKRNLSSCLLLAISFSGCASGIWPFSKDSNDSQQSTVQGELRGEQKDIVGPTGSSRPGDPRAASGQDMELKQAKIWNRLDEIEEQLRVQKEQIKLLEQGLLTGIPPESLKNRSRTIHTNNFSKDDSVRVPAKRPHLQDESGVEGLPSPIVDKQEISISTESDKLDPEGFRVKLQVAKDLYQASRFGLAISELAQISKKFGSKVGDGEVKYYLGRSYLGLKEFMSARTELENFIKEFPGNPSVGMAKLDLAKAYTGLNLRERARKELANVAKDYEGREEGDIAANELRSIRGAL